MKAKSMTYGEQLRDLIEKHNINRVELAREYGCIPVNVQKAMHSKTMKPDTFDKWVKAINSLLAKKETQRLRDKLNRIRAILEE